VGKAKLFGFFAAALLGFFAGFGVSSSSLSTVDFEARFFGSIVTVASQNCVTFTKEEV